MSAIGWFDESTVHSLIGAAREELLTIDQIEQRHRLAAQGMDDVPIIDHMTAFAAGMRSPQRDQRRRAEETFEPIVIQPHAKPMADQARGHRIEHLRSRTQDILWPVAVVGGSGAAFASAISEAAKHL